MTDLNITVYFWFIALGMTVGFVFSWMLKDWGVSLRSNMIWAVIGSVVTGTLGVIFGLADGLLYAFMGTLAILFLVNVFHQHHDEDLFGHIDRGIHIHSK